MILADNGSHWYISGAPSPHWSNDQLHALGGLHRLRLRGRRHLEAAAVARPSNVVPARAALDLDVAAHRGRELLDDREPEPAADRPVAADLVVEVEALERVRHVVGRDARGRCRRRARRPGVARAPSPSRRRRLAQRVLDEVRRDLQQPVVVGLDPRLVALGGERDAEVARRAPRAGATASRATSARSTGSRRTENSLRFMRARSSRSRTSRSSRLASSEIVRAASSGVERALGEPFRVAADRGQRRLQLVADREQEVALGLARRGELLGHLVERLARARRARSCPSVGSGSWRSSAASARVASATRRIGRDDRARDAANESAAASAAPASAASSRSHEERAPRGRARGSPGAAAAGRGAAACGTE